MSKVILIIPSSLVCYKERLAKLFSLCTDNILVPDSRSQAFLVDQLIIPLPTIINR